MPAETELNVRQRTSWIAALGFLFGLGAALTVLAAVIVYLTAQFSDLLEIDRHERKFILIAARIVAVCAVVPAIGALAFWLGARGLIRESEGTLRGRGLYRTGLALAVLSLVVTFGGPHSLGGAISLSMAEAEAVAAPYDAVPPPRPRGKYVATALVRMNPLVLRRVGGIPAAVLAEEVHSRSPLQDLAMRERLWLAVHPTRAGLSVDTLEEVFAERQEVDDQRGEVLFRLQAHSNDPAEAVTLANLFAETWVDHSKRIVRRRVEERVRSLQQQLSEARSPGQHQRIRTELEVYNAFLENPFGRLELFRNAAEAVETTP